MMRGARGRGRAVVRSANWYVGSGCGRGRGRGRGRAVRGVRAAVQQRVQPAPARAPHPRGAAGGVRHVRALLQDAAVPAPAHAGAAPARAPASQAAAAARAAARPELPTVAAPARLATGGALPARRRYGYVRYCNLPRYHHVPPITVAHLIISGNDYRELFV